MPRDWVVEVETTAPVELVTVTVVEPSALVTDVVVCDPEEAPDPAADVPAKVAAFELTETMPLIEPIHPKRTPQRLEFAPARLPRP